jgi:tetratricopeptide (TPR) repeat protein
VHRPTLSVLTVAALAACASRATLPVASAQAAEPAAAPTATASEDSPRYNAAGELLPPTNYRHWRFLTSGYGMSYGPSATSGPKPHDNVYVNPAAYDQFLATGQWPEQTLFVLEIRSSESEGSIDHGGQFQTELLAIEAEVKDSKRFEGGWAFFNFATDGMGPAKPARSLPREASCYSCHAKNGAVENTFTQFYPTLFPVARAKGTVRADFIGMPPTLGELFQRASAEGWPAGEHLLGEAATRWPGARVLQEGALNQLGYRLLQAGKKPAALAVFEHVTQKYPASANAWDSLSEAYEGAGNLEGARSALGEARKRLVEDKTLDQVRRANLQRALDARATRLATVK